MSLEKLVMPERKEVLKEMIGACHSDMGTG